MWRSSILGLVLIAGACASEPTAPSGEGAVEPSRQAIIADGRDIAEAQCAACHAVGPYGVSPNAEAPPFRTVLSRYNADVLEQELIEGIRVTHPMPDFQFNPQGVDALIAYLEAIQETPAPLPHTP